MVNAKSTPSLVSVLAAALFVLVASAGGPARPVPAFSADIPRLFTSTTLPSELIEQAARQEKLNPDIVRSRYVRINAKALDAVGPIGLDLFDDVIVTATKTRLEKRSADRYSWFGRIDTARVGQVVLAFEKGVLGGDVRTSTGAYHIAYVGKGVHAIRQYRTLLRPELEDFIPRDPEIPVGRWGGNVLLSPIVDVLVVYTPAARDAAGGAAAIETQVQLSVDWTNQAFRNSQVGQVLRLAYVYEVPFTEAMDIAVRGQDALDHLRDANDGVIDDVHRTRDKVGADLVSLLCFHGCGMAGIGGQFSVANWHSPSTFAHELGHNMGSNHEKAIAPFGGWFPYSNGYTDPNGAWHDIMAYGVDCGFSCPEIPHFSNPNVNYNGVPTGLPDGSVDANGNSNSADAARTLTETAPIVAGYRDTPAMIGIPGTGGTLTCCQVTFTAQARANAEYFWSFGTGKDLADVIAWVPTGATRSAAVTLPNWIAGQTLWVRLYTRIGGPTGTWHFRDHTYSVQ